MHTWTAHITYVGTHSLHVKMHAFYPMALQTRTWHCPTYKEMHVCALPHISWKQNWDSTVLMKWMILLHSHEGSRSVSWNTWLFYHMQSLLSATAWHHPPHIQGIIMALSALRKLAPSLNRKGCSASSSNSGAWMQDWTQLVLVLDHVTQFRVGLGKTLGKTPIPDTPPQQ